jgi:hypothetical protein
LKALALIVSLAMTSIQCEAKQLRSNVERHAFVKENPCPSTGRARLPCPGYIIDHVVPLCAGGPDKPINMQWQTVEEAKTKDRIEREQCRRK